MKPLTLQDVRRAIGGRSTQVLSASGPTVSAVCTDTRKMKLNSLFVAIIGEKYDPHDFLNQATGATAAVVSRIPSDAPKGVPLLVVSDTRVALGKLAALSRKELRAKVVAVAGSNGKTSTKYLIDSVLSSKLKGSCSPKSFNNDIGVPVTIFDAGEKDDYLVLELGTNHPGEIRNLTKIAQPDVAVITNCGEEHLEFLGDVAGVRRENASIIECLNPKGLLIVNGDDADLVAAVADYRGKKITFGFKKTNDLFATNIVCDQSGVRFKMNGRLDVFVPLLGKHTVLNSLAAIAVAKKFLLEEEEIVAALAKARGPEMRLQLEQVNGITVLNDAYNANPASMKAAIETLQSLATNGRRVAVLGDMLELGKTGEKHHADIGTLAAKCGFDQLVCVGPLSRLVADTARKAGMAESKVQLFPDADAAADSVPGMLVAGDVVLLKGSRGIHLETVAKAIKEKKR